MQQSLSKMAVAPLDVSIRSPPQRPLVSFKHSVHHTLSGPSRLGPKPHTPAGLHLSPPLLQGPALRLRLRSRSWCVRVGLAPAISRAVASCRNTWAEGQELGLRPNPPLSPHTSALSPHWEVRGP